MIILLPISILILGLWLVFTQHTAWTESLIYPFLANHDFKLYKDLIHPYTPLFVWFMQGITYLFGYSPQVSWWLTGVLAFINLAAIFFVSRRLWNLKSAVLSTLFYSLWFGYFQGNGLWFELFQTSSIIFSFYFFYLYLFNKKSLTNLILGSLILSLSFYIKQSALWIIIVVWGSIVVSQKIKSLKTLGQSGLIFILVSLAVAAVALVGGYLREFIYWSFYYTFSYFPTSPGHNVYPSIRELIKLIFTVGLALVPFFWSRFSREKLFGGAFLIATFMSSLPRWGLFHLQPFLAILSIIAMPFLLDWWQARRTWKKITIIIFLLIWSVVSIRQALRFTHQQIRFFEPEVYQTADKLKSLNITSFESINSADQLYLLTNTVPPVKPYVQYYAWFLELPGMQEAQIAALEKSKVNYLLYSTPSGGNSYNIGEYRPTKIMDYINTQFKPVKKISDNIWLYQRK